MQAAEVHQFTPAERQTPCMNIEKLLLEHKSGVKTSKYLCWKLYPEAAAVFKWQQGASTTGQQESWHTDSSGISLPLSLLEDGLGGRGGCNSCFLPILQCSASIQPSPYCLPSCWHLLCLDPLFFHPCRYTQHSPPRGSIQPSAGLWGVEVGCLRDGNCGGGH